MLSIPHPLVLQLRFTRSKFKRPLKGVDDPDSRRRIPPMKCISWNVGHLAWQEQDYLLWRGHGRVHFARGAQAVRLRAPGSQPPFNEMLAA